MEFIQFNAKIQKKDNYRTGFHVPKEYNDLLKNRTFTSILGTTGAQPIVRLKEDNESWDTQVMAAGDNSWFPLSQEIESHLSLQTTDEIEVQSWKNELIINRVTKREGAEEIQKNLENTWKEKE